MRVSPGMKVTAAVAVKPGAALSIASLELEEPRSDEILVRMVSSGICHSDIVVRNRGETPAQPVVLGHEGAGVVERVGASVGHLRSGDRVVLSFASCGRCSNCRSGHPAYCVEFLALNMSGQRADGSTCLTLDGERIGSHFFGQSSFAHYAVANASCAVKVASDLPLCALGPLGCGIQTGAGAVLNALSVTAGSSIVVFGVGGVGLSALLAAVAVGCTSVIAVDRDPRRLALAAELGATQTFGAAAVDAAALVEVTRGGADFSVETTGVPSVVRLAVESLRLGGACGLHGATQAGEGGLDLASLPPGRTVTYLVEGDAVPQVFIPRLLRLQEAGRFPFEKLLRYYNFDDINTAIDDSSTGATVKPVLTFPEP